jgi:hypothetical protein
MTKPEKKWKPLLPAAAIVTAGLLYYAIATKKAPLSLGPGSGEMQLTNNCILVDSIVPTNPDTKKPVRSPKFLGCHGVSVEITEDGTPVIHFLAGDRTQLKAVYSFKLRTNQAEGKRNSVNTIVLDLTGDSQRFTSPGEGNCTVSSEDFSEANGAPLQCTFITTSPTTRRPGDPYRLFGATAYFKKPIAPLFREVIISR